MAGDLIRVAPATLPTPGGHYSYAVVAQGLVHVSGLLPIDAQGQPMAEASFEAQTARVLENLRTVLQASGSDVDRLVQVRVYIASIEHWGRFNALYAAWIGEHRPARAIVPTGALHFGLQLEIEAVALAAPTAS
jgi:reactive intermediate/imine deaminase